jgi:hypothetical protein
VLFTLRIRDEFQNPCYARVSFLTYTFLKTYSRNRKQQEIVCLLLLPPFYIGRRIRDEKILEPGSATLGPLPNQP